MLTGLAVLCDFVPEVSIPQGVTSRRRTVMETMPTWLPEDTSQVHNTHTSLSLTHPRVGEQNTILVLTKRGLEKRIPSQFRVCPGRVPLCRVGTSSRPPSSFMPSCTRGPGAICYCSPEEENGRRRGCPRDGAASPVFHLAPECVMCL